MKLWLDDVRNPIHFGCIGWTWAHTYEEAIAYLGTGTVKEASLDHDLSVEATMGMQPPDEKTGYSVVCWMEEHNVWPARVAVHSFNPAGTKRMMDVIGRHTTCIRRRL